MTVLPRDHHVSEPTAWQNAGLPYQWRRVLSSITLVAFLLPALGTLPADAQSETEQSEQELEQLEGQIEDAEAEVGELDTQVEISVSQLNEILAEQQELQGQLNALNDELARAQAELENREGILTATTAELEATEIRLRDTREQLDLQKAALEARVRQSYMNARADEMLPLFTAQEAAEFAQASTYLEALTLQDRAGFELIEVLRTNIEADEAELERLKVQQDSDRVAAQAERDRVAELVTAQQAVVAQVEARAAEKQTVLDGLEADKASAEELVAEFQAESDRIEAELAAAAAAAAAAEAARQAEAERAAQAAAAAAGSTAPAGSGSASSGTSDAVAVGSGRFLLPINGRVSSEFGYRIHPISGVRKLHAGMDIGGGNGTPIGAAGAGTVIYAGWRGGYGNTVIVDHGGGIATLYAHQSRVGSSVGQSVSAGQVIGYVGSTGYSTGPHLHWEVRVNGTPVNPRGYL